MRNLLGRDLAWIRRGVGLWKNPESMLRDIRKEALRQGPRYWTWKYAWSLVEKAVHQAFETEAQGGSAPLRRPALHGDP